MMDATMDITKEPQKGEGTPPTIGAEAREATGEERPDSCDGVKILHTLSSEVPGELATHPDPLNYGNNIMVSERSFETPSPVNLPFEEAKNEVTSDKSARRGDTKPYGSLGQGQAVRQAFLS